MALTLYRLRLRFRLPGHAVASKAAIAACVSALWGLPATAQQTPQSYPNKPIRVVVPFAAGGPVDLIGRILIQKLNVSMAQPFVLDNRGGAGSVVGSDIVAKSPPDGYTWLLTTGSLTSIAAFNENVPFDAVRDFTPVTMVARNFGQVLIVHPSVPARTVKELIALARSRPGKMNYASAGIGNITYIAAEMMKAMTGVQITDIQYKGTGPAFNDLLGGHVDMCFAPTQTALPLIQTGRVRALAMTGPSRWKVLPDLPTMRESGLKDYDLVGWFGLWLPPGTSPQLLSRIHSETVRALGEADVKLRFDELGLEPVGTQPDAFAGFIKQDVAAMRELARKIGLAANNKR
ncbi:MAG TPA: tripartite tricarboxylate transporter substrate binding protein [Burkholderiales bacterium]|nr:tripartite tricarboxylate transporter substrate binding protein [Burkholderiales bacterium]